MQTRLRLSVANGIATGGVAAWFYANAAGRDGDLWQALHFNPWNYLAMILVCCGNTFVFFALLQVSSPTSLRKGFLLGGLVASAGSFLCSLAMGIGTGGMGNLMFGTAFFLPISGLVGSVAGLVLAGIVRHADRRA